ncbi:Tonsoku-like protein [Acipenser ruthenus]|uniref:Tonsoku-like protein n=1 Tax=Acipenser ruthenus TaxID=7906 RepID=A0A444U010_ACIRT|nr:Tonsoku-like protein [Acipenser ruthenus]
MREIIWESLSRELAISGKVLSRELSEMRACLYLNLGFVYDGLKEKPALQNQLLEDLYRANFNLGSIHFRNGQHAKECARLCVAFQVLLNLCDFVAAKRALKKAYTMGSQQPSKRGEIRRSHKYASGVSAAPTAEVQQKLGSPDTDSTVSRLQDLCGLQGWSDGESEGEEEQEEEENSEELEDSDLELSESGEGRRRLLMGMRRRFLAGGRLTRSRSLLYLIESLPTGCLVSGPWDSISLDSLSCCLQEFLFTEAQQTGQGGSGVGQETVSDQCNVTAQQVFH